MDDSGSLFGARHTAGEFLFFEAALPLGPVVIGLTPGAVEVGFATAYVAAGDLRFVPSTWFERGQAAQADLNGRCVVLADDGLTPTFLLVGALRALAAAGPSRLVLLCPWVPVGLEQNVDVAIEVVALSRDGVPVGLPLYAPTDTPSVERIAWCLDAVASGGFTGDREVFRHRPQA